MKSRIEQYVFDEPSGWTTGLLFFAFSAVFFGIYAYYGILRDSGSVSELVIGTAFALSGLAESLPESRRYLAGILRVTAIGAVVLLLALTALVPEIVLDGRW